MSVQRMGAIIHGASGRQPARGYAGTARTRKSPTANGWALLSGGAGGSQIKTLCECLPYQKPFVFSDLERCNKTPLRLGLQGRLAVCPQSVALGVSPVNRLRWCPVADAGSIPHQADWSGQIAASRLPYSTTTRLNPSSTNEGMESGAGNIKLFKVLFACRP